MGKFNFKKYSSSIFQRENSLIKVADIDYFIKNLEVPGTGKTFQQLFKETVPNETQEQKKSRKDELTNKILAIKNDKIFMKALSIAENELKSQKSVGIYRHIKDINDKLFSMAMEKYFVNFQEGAMKMNFENNWSSQQQNSAILEWKNGLTDGMQGGGFAGRGDFIYLLVRQMVAAIRQQKKWHVNNSRKFDVGRVELFFHQCEDDPSKLTFKNYERLGDQAVVGVVHTQEIQNQSGGTCGFIKTSTPGWFFLYGKKSQYWCSEKFTEQTGPFQGSEIQDSKNHALLFAASQNTGWCTGNLSANHYLTISEKFYLYFPQGQPLDQSGRVNQAAIAIVVNTDNSYKECVGHNNSAPWSYLSQIVDVMEAEGIKSENGSRFGYNGGVSGNTPFEWYKQNKDKSPAEIFDKIGFVLEQVKNTINSHDNIVDLALDIQSKDFKQNIANKTDNNIESAASMGIFPEIIKKSGAKDEFLNRLESHMKDINPKLHIIFKDILSSILPGLGSITPAKDQISKNFRSLITQKALPKEEEELLFKDDKESTIREIVDHFIYK
jgi:hypothetical protein